MGPKNDFQLIPKWESAEEIWHGHTVRVLLVTVHAVVVVAAIVFYFFGWDGLAATIGASVMLFYISLILFRFVMMAASMLDRRDTGKAISVYVLPDVKLKHPHYTIVCPLYRESTAIRGLVGSLSSMIYDPNKMDIIFVVEKGDAITYKGLAGATLKSNMRIHEIPDATHIRSKPRAMNSVLPFCRDDGYLTVYDAEDRPDSLQLRIAADTFDAYPEEVVCLQAKIKHYNWNQNMITRWFSAEYSVWYDYVLPALGYFRLPVPLGGNSNHFRTMFLKHALFGWDSYNVTEDADIGMRIARMGGKTRILQSPTGMIDSTTLEEAEPTFRGWIRERSRWMKGFMQTFLVHSRNPVRLYRDLGFMGTVAFVMILAGTPATHLLNIGLFGIFSAWLLFEPAWINLLFPESIRPLHFFTFVVGNVLFISMHVAAALRENKKSVAFASLIIPLYWIMMCLATVKAVFQLAFNPHKWEHTTHLRKGENK